MTGPRFRRSQVDILAIGYYYMQINLHHRTPRHLTLKVRKLKLVARSIQLKDFIAWEISKI